MDAVQSDNEDKIDKLMNGFDTEFITPEEIELTDNTGNVNVLTLEATVHAVDQCTTHTEELETNKKRKKTEESTPITWTRNVSSLSRKNCLFEGRAANQFDKSASDFDIYEQIINLDFISAVFQTSLSNVSMNM